MLNSSPLLRPNTATVQRRHGTGGVDFAGEPQYTVLSLATFPCLIDPLPVSGRSAAALEYTVEGVIYIQTHIVLVFGLTPADVAAFAPGDTITKAGVPYIVAPNKLGAFIDAQAGDRMVDERGLRYLCLGQAQYYNIVPHCELRLAIGRAWLAAGESP